MIESDSAATPIISPQVVLVDDTSHDYPISREGRRQAIVLLLGVVSLWVFALWSLINLFEGGISGIEWVSLVLMLGIVLVAPVVGWALLEEAGSRITTDDNGIRYRSIAGIDLLYKWEELSGFQPTDRKSKVARFFLGDESSQAHEDLPIQNAEGLNAKQNRQEAELLLQVQDNGEADVEPDTRLLQTPDRTAQIKNPLARILHKLSHGASLPLYGGIERRDDLLDEIKRMKDKG